MSDPWRNPFDAFLTAANAEFQSISREPDLRSNPTLVRKFVEISERRNFVFDIVQRVGAVAASFDRARELRDLYLRAEAEWNRLISSQKASDPGRVRFDVPEVIVSEIKRYGREAQAFTALVYYEFSTIAALMKPWFVPPGNSQLEYVVGVRNKILAHARADAYTKNSDCAISIGPILVARLVGGQIRSPLLRDWYRKKLPLHEQVNEDEGANKNEALLRGSKWIDKFDSVEKLRLRSYSIPEPDLLLAAKELSVLLTAHFLPEINGACADRAPAP